MITVEGVESWRNHLSGKFASASNNPIWPWTLQGQRCLIYVLIVPLSPKFHTSLLYYQPAISKIFLSFHTFVFPLATLLKFNFSSLKFQNFELQLMWGLWPKKKKKKKRIITVSVVLEILSHIVLCWDILNFLIICMKVKIKKIKTNK